MPNRKLGDYKETSIEALHMLTSQFKQVKPLYANLFPERTSKSIFWFKKELPLIA